MKPLNFFMSSPISRVLERLDLQLMDVGARGGMDEDLHPAAWCISATGFEPEAAECARLNGTPSAPWRATTYIPTALGGTDDVGTLHLPRNDVGASLLPHNPAMLPRFGHDALHETVDAIAVSTCTLDTALKDYRIRAPDYLKIDVEGAELAILGAANRAIADCSAIKVEVSFLEQRTGQPLMHEVLEHLLACGFVLAEIRGIHSWRRRPLPCHPLSAKWAVPYSRGLAAQCDLVMLRDPATCSGDASRLTRLMAISAVLGFFDHAVTALRAAESLESDLGREIDGDFVRELGRVSRRMGRAVALNEVGARLRSIVPLIRSLGPGVPGPGSIRSGY